MSRWPTVLLAAAIMFAAYVALTVYAPRPHQDPARVTTVLLTTPSTRPSCLPVSDRYNPATGMITAC